MARESYSLQDRVVLITGAARGIGAATARRLVGLGARVALVGLEPAELERLSEELGPATIWIEADVTDRERMETVAAETVARLGGIDVVIANAGIGVGGSVLTVDPDAFERVVEVNLMGVWRTVRACLPYVVKSRGYVLNVASVAAIVQPPGMASYSMSKAGVEGFSNALRAEVAHRGVGVGVAYFSWLDTDLVRAAAETRTFQVMMSRMKGPGTRTYPVEAGVEAIVRGIQRRSPVVVAPGWVRPLLYLRGAVLPLINRAAASNFAELERISAQEEAAKGPFSGVGPGTQAALDAQRTAART